VLSQASQLQFYKDPLVIIVTDPQSLYVLHASAQTAISAQSNMLQCRPDIDPRIAFARKAIGPAAV
jgi:hypothetical protein